MKSNILTSFQVLNIDDTWCGPYDKATCTVDNLFDGPFPKHALVDHSTAGAPKARLKSDQLPRDRAHDIHGDLVVFWKALVGDDCAAFELLLHVVMVELGRGELLCC